MIYGTMTMLQDIVHNILTMILHMVIIIHLNHHGLDLQFIFAIQMNEENKIKNAKVRMKLKNISKKL